MESNWISVKEKLPREGQIIIVKTGVLFKRTYRAIYMKKYFIKEGENITQKVTHWCAGLKKRYLF